MFTKLIMDGVLKIAQVIRYENKRRIARVYDPKATIPEAVLNEVRENHFIDHVNGKEYILTVTGLVPVA